MPGCQTHPNRTRSAGLQVEELSEPSVAAHVFSFRFSIHFLSISAKRQSTGRLLVAIAKSRHFASITLPKPTLRSSSCRITPPRQKHHGRLTKQLSHLTSITSACHSLHITVIPDPRQTESQQAVPCDSSEELRRHRHCFQSTIHQVIASSDGTSVYAHSASGAIAQVKSCPIAYECSLSRSVHQLISSLSAHTRRNYKRHGKEDAHRRARSSSLLRACSATLSMGYTVCIHILSCKPCRPFTFAFRSPRQRRLRLECSCASIHRQGRLIERMARSRSRSVDEAHRDLFALAFDRHARSNNGIVCTTSAQSAGLGRRMAEVPVSTLHSNARPDPACSPINTPWSSEARSSISSRGSASHVTCRTTSASLGCRHRDRRC